MFVKCACKHCRGHIEFDDGIAGLPIVCPHCGSETNLYIPDAPLPIPKIQAETPPTIHGLENDIMPGKWMDEPMSEKQKAMFILYGIESKDGVTKGEASQLIDNAMLAGTKPTNETQSKAGELFGKIRLNEIVIEITDAITIIGDETVTIKTLKVTKRNVKESVKKLTDIIDKRIETIQNQNREVRFEKTSEWLKERGLM